MSVSTFTLDTNCLIALENEEPNAVALCELVSRHLVGSVNVACVAISASEKQKTGSQLSNFQEFQDRLKMIGLSQIENLKPKGYWDITFLDWCLWADETETVESNLHKILFPSHQFDAPVAVSGIEDQNVSQLSKWRNRKCDVLALWTHVHERRRYFVTSDMNFSKKKAALDSAGFGIIVSPNEALNFI